MPGLMHVPEMGFAAMHSNVTHVILPTFWNNIYALAEIDAVNIHCTIPQQVDLTLPIVIAKLDSI